MPDIPTEVTKTNSNSNTPGALVLQWLTYAFWGWTVLALAWLTAVSVGHFIDKPSTDYSGVSNIAYSLAAVVVLFVIALICDVLYSRREPLHKTGAATVIMIIHAVLFALFGIGALIVAVFAVVSMLIGDSGDYDGSGSRLTVLITGLLIAIVYAGTLLRTLRPLKLKYSALMYWVFMALVTGGVVVLGVVGPIVYAAQTSDDRLIERGLPSVSQAISEYAEEKQALPKSLDDIKGEVKGDAATLLNRNMVEYKPGETKTEPEIRAQDLGTQTNDNQTSIAPIAPPDYKGKWFTYELCVTYKAEKDVDAVKPLYLEADYRSVSPNTYAHDAGRVCYKLQTNYISDDIYR